MKPSPSIEYKQLPHIYITSEMPIGQRMIILAESSQGNLYDPLVVTSISLAQAIFGSGPLIERFKDFVKGSGTSAYLMRIEAGSLDMVYKTLIKFPFDLIYIDKFFFNNNQKEIEKFIEFAKDKEYQGELIHGFFELNGLNTMPEIRTVYEEISSLSTIIEDGIDELGKYMSVVANQIKDHHAALVYAGLVSSLDPEISPINKTIDEVELEYELTKENILELRSAGIVCFKNTLKRGVVCTSSSCAVTTETSGSKHISNFRIAQYIIQEIAINLQQYIGRIGIPSAVMEAEALVEEILEQNIVLDRIKRFDYTVEIDSLHGKADFYIEIVPVFSLYSIVHSSQVRVNKQ